MIEVPGLPHHEGEDAKRLFGQEEFVAILAQLAGLQIEEVVTEPDDLLT